MFFSTRNESLRLTASEVILKGLSDEGGLFLPEKIFNLKVDEKLLQLSYPELAYVVLRPYLDDFTDEEVRNAVLSAYDKNHFEEKVMDVTTFSNHSIMELFHGQTLTFKDMALSLLPYLMEAAKSKHPETKKIKILTATSGDTGSAVLSSFAAVGSIDVSILYPMGGISPLQEKQMLYFTLDHSRAYALESSNFDDCQSFVKSMLISHEKEGYTSANSINIGRLLPQIVYYYYSYCLLVKRGVLSLGKKLDVVVPTGNFGDIFAGYLAKKMGLPIERLVVASNQNRILTDFFKTGKYDLHREFMKTNSPSMDILISSNLERLMYYLYQDSDKVTSLMKDLKEKKEFTIEEDKLANMRETFSAYCCDEEETKKTIASCYQEHHYLLDPHSAVAFQCAMQYQMEKSDRHCLIIATASPLKFAKTICESLHLDYPDDQAGLENIIKETKLSVPHALKKVLDCKTPREAITKENAEHVIFDEHKYLIDVPATSANLGPGFDVLGIALKKYNRFSFQVARLNELLGFGEFNNKNNLVLTSYEHVFETLGIKPVPVRIEQVEQDIPLERGLGSSSSCIVAGLLGANEVLHHKLSKDEIYQMAIDLEGHPDNVAPCLLGGLIGNMKDEVGKYHAQRFEVSEDLSFVLVVPSERVNTKHAREVMPGNYSLDDVRFNLSRIVLLPEALRQGDTKLLHELLKDRIHVPYRRSLISCFSVLEQISNKLHLPFTISGSGSTMIYIIRDNQQKALLKELNTLKATYNFDISVVKEDKVGATIKED